MAGRLGVAVVCWVLLAAAVGGVVATPAGVAGSATATGGGQLLPETDSTVTRIEVAPNGTAAWQVQVLTRLENDAEVAEYETFQDRFRDNRSDEIRFQFEVDESVDSPRIKADAGEMTQVLTNLLDNACHAVDSTDSPEIDLRIQQDSDRLFLRIGDNGEPIPEDIRDKMFEPFYTTKSPGEGTGMGLSIVNGFIDSMDGSITVEQPEDDRKQFVVELPAIV